jgi:hypothetical protein
MAATLPDHWTANALRHWFATRAYAAPATCGQCYLLKEIEDNLADAH